MPWFVPLLAAVLTPAPTDLSTRVHTSGAPCDGAPLSERVGAQLDTSGQPITIDADATLHRRDDGQWQLDLEITRGDTEPSVRTFVAPECGTAMDAAALVIALAIVEPPPTPATTPTTTDVPPPPQDPPTPTTTTPTTTTKTPTPTTTTPPAATPTTTTKSRRKFRGLVRAGGGVDVGALPGAAAFFEAAGGLLGAHWRLEATASYRLQSTDRARLDPRAGGRFSTWAIGARGCGVPTTPLPRAGQLEFPLCAGLEGGRLVVEGFGFDGARTTRRPWGAATVGPGIAWSPRRNVALVLQSALGVPMVRSAIEIDGLERLHVTRPVFARVWLGFEGRFP